MFYKMESDDKLKEIDVKKYTCYYFDDIVKIEDFSFSNVSIDEKSSENIFVYNISYKSLIKFDKVKGFLRVYDGTKYLILLAPSRFDAIYNRIRYLIEVKRGITYVFSNNYARIKFDSYDSLTFHNFIIHIKSVLNNDQNHYYYNIFSKKVHIDYPKITIIKTLCINYKCYILIEFTFLKEFILIKQAHQNNATIVAISIFKIKG